MRNALIRLGDGANAIPYLAALRNEVVIGIITRSAALSLS